jgi:hypothetical protein
MNQQLKLRFNELERQAQEVLATKVAKHSEFIGSYLYIESDLILGWCVKARHLLSITCGKTSEHYTTFVEAEDPQPYEDSPIRFSRLLSVFLAAKEDFEGGYFTTIRNLVQADVFTDELQQADALLEAGYHVPAAVIAGVVLETALRDVCVQNGLPPGKLSKMNDDLAKASHYNSIVHKQITAIAGVRNSAAHGKNQEFTEEDVVAMIRDVERLLATWLN